MQAVTSTPYKHVPYYLKQSPRGLYNFNLKLFRKTFQKLIYFIIDGALAQS